MLKHFFSRILLVVNAVMAFFLLLGYVSVFISPEKLWIFAFVGMAYPFFLVMNLLFVILWALFRKWYVVISLACILIGWNPLRNYIQLRFSRHLVENTENHFKVLTYNVRLFNYYQWISDPAAGIRIIDYVSRENPDIVCFQEFITIPGTESDLDSIKRKLGFLPYVHVSYTNTIPGTVQFGMATFSRYPIVNQGEVNFPSTLNGSIYSDIAFQSDTYRIYNCHLQSVQLNNSYDHLIDSLIFNYNEKQLAEIKDISSKLRRAFIQRAHQVDILSADIAQSPYPVIVCGDFNDTPLSYTYHELGDGLKDAFVGSGSGLGSTYRGFVPYMRIDYILHDPDFEVSDFRIEKSGWSDHYPVVSRFIVPPKADAPD